jgi:hypothetical protein
VGPEASGEPFYRHYSPSVKVRVNGKEEQMDMRVVAYCVTHRPAKLSPRERARLALAAGADCQQSVPHGISLIYPCKAQQEEGLLVFGPMGDMVLTNANESEARAAKERRNERESATQKLSRLVGELSAPRPWFQIVHCRPDTRFDEFRDHEPSMAEMRARIYWALSGGCHGLCYRGWDESLGPGIRRAVASVEAELDQVRDVLAPSYPVGRGTCDDPKVEVCILQSGFEALLLLVINHDYQYLLGADLKTFPAWRRKRDLKIRLIPPVSLPNLGAYWIRDRQREKLRVDFQQNEVVVTVPSLAQAELLLLEPSKANLGERF